METRAPIQRSMKWNENHGIIAELCWALALAWAVENFSITPFSFQDISKRLSSRILYCSSSWTQQGEKSTMLSWNSHCVGRAHGFRICTLIMKEKVMTEQRVDLLLKVIECDVNLTWKNNGPYSTTCITCNIEDRPSGLVAGENDPRCRFFSFTAANRPLL